MEEIKIEYKGKEEVVKLRGLTWGEQNDCIRKATTTTRDGKQMDEVTLHEQRLLKSIEGAPFPKNIESLRALPNKIGDELFTVMQKLNSITEEDSKNLSTPSTEENSLVTETSTTSS
jgi:hypothetical protein